MSKSRTLRKTNLQHGLFYGNHHGPEFYIWITQLSLLFLALELSFTLNSVFKVNLGWAELSWPDWSLVLLNFLPLFLVMRVLLPRLVGKLCICISVEYLKDEKVIVEIVQEREKDQLTEALQVIALVRLRGLMGKGKVTAENRIKALKEYQLHSNAKRAEVREVFQYMDLDGNGHVSMSDLCEALNFIGLKEDTVVGLFRLLDTDNSGVLDEREFEGLIALSMLHKSKEQEAEDYDNFFTLFDTKNNGKVEVAEMSFIFSSIGSNVSESFIASTIVECFKQLKNELAREEFSRWLYFLREKYSHGAQDLNPDEDDDANADSMKGSFKRNSRTLVSLPTQADSPPPVSLPNTIPTAWM